MATSATPVQLVNPDTGAPYAGSSKDTVTTPGFQKQVGADNVNTGQVAVGTSSTLVVGARAGRQKVTLSPTTSTVYYVGNNGVSSTNGLYVAAGGITTLDTSAAIYAAGASALTISFIEYF